ncbi:VOC family protein [Spirillospora sp. CA-108201]
MPEVESYELGEPNWVEVSSPDVQVSKRFYGGLLGWSSYDVTDAFVGDFSIFTLGDATGPETAGLTRMADDTITATWTCYFNVQNASAAAERVRQAGGLVYMEATDVAHLGRVALAADPQGAEFGLWQPYAFAGCGVVGELNTVSKVGLVTRDPIAAQRFYGHVLGWKEPAVYQGMVVESVYEWEIVGRLFPFMLLANEELLGEGLRAYWLPYVVVADCDASLAEAVVLGGSVNIPLTQSMFGPSAIIKDPTSARLGLLQQRS